MQKISEIILSHQTGVFLGHSFSPLLIAFCLREVVTLIPIPAPSTDESLAGCSRLFILVIDVGQGDSTLVVSPKAALLMDAGDYVRLDGSMVIQSVLSPLGRKKLDYLVLSHYDAVYMGDFVTVGKEKNSLILETRKENNRRVESALQREPPPFGLRLQNAERICRNKFSSVEVWKTKTVSHTSTEHTTTKKSLLLSCS